MAKGHVDTYITSCGRVKKCDRIRVSTGFDKEMFNTLNKLAKSENMSFAETVRRIVGLGLKQAGVWR